MNLLRIAIRNLLRNKSGTIRNIVAVSIPSVVLMLLLGFVGGIEKDMEHVISKYLAGDVRIQNKDYGENEIFNPSYYLIEDAQQLVKELLTIKEVKAISQKIFFPVTVQDGKIFERMNILGLDFEEEEQYNNFSDLVIEGRIPEKGKREMLIGTTTAEEFGFKIGDNITFFGGTFLKSQNGLSAKVVGLVQYPAEELNKRKFVLSLDNAQYFFKSPNAVSEIDVRKKTHSFISASDLQEKITTLLAGINTKNTLLVEPWMDISAYYAIFQTARVIYLVVGLVFCVLGSLILYNTMHLSIFSRKYELGVLNAMGFSNAMLRKMFSVEVIFVVLLGSTWGVLVGLGLVALLNYTGVDMVALGNNLQGTIMSRYQHPYISIRWIAIIFVYTTVASFFIGVLPVRILKKETVLSLLKSD